MISSSKIKSVDFYRKIPRDLTEASLSGAGLSIIAALAMMFLFGMELNNYLAVSTSTAVVVDKSSDGEFLRIELNISFPALSCEFASVDVNDILGTNRLNISKTIRKFSIDRNLRPTGSEFHPGPLPKLLKHGDDGDEEYGEGAVSLSADNFDRVAHQFPILAVNFFAPWCQWSIRLKPSWEKTAQIIRERYDPEMDGRILLAKVDCTIETEMCRSNLNYPVCPGLCVLGIREERSSRFRFKWHKNKSLTPYQVGFGDNQLTVVVDLCLWICTKTEEEEG
ncbi:hypothetical protein IFM89_018829 [Coptis chinensis]|uniref:Thioredoxin domain-containing protein n=1 Tax=Coptis chinensis TaxID=261450 RepID=A0A835H033_9MAGN|nr:hypothetical protein IFM89_018829 [Coptis chinensis]